MMRLAAHLCGPALNQVLRGDVSFVEELAAKGFGRVQLNATAVRSLLTRPAAVVVYLAHSADVTHQASLALL